MSTTGYRSPPPEPHKPPIPYQKDTYLRIQRIEPPPPFATSAWDFAPSYIKDFITQKRTVTRSDLDKLTIVEVCLSQMALPSKVVDETETAELRILDSLAVEDGRGAQVFTCTTSNEPSKVLVAKVYDPLYYPSKDDEWPYNAFDTTLCADIDFTEEAATYSALNANLGGRLIPEYYGAWAFTQSLQGQSRTIYLILMEHLQGIPLSNFDPASYTKSERLNVVAKVMEAEVMRHYYGVNDYDVAPRNIMLSPGYTSLGDPELQIRLFDFNKAEVLSYSGFKPPAHTKTRPESPITYWEDGYPALPGWIDYNFYKDGDSWNAWIRQRWEQDSRFLPPTSRS